MSYTSADDVKFRISGASSTFVGVFFCKNCCDFVDYLAANGDRKSH